MKANLNYDSEEHIFVNPTKKIISEDQKMKFLTSASALDLSMFLVETQKSVKGSRMTDTQVPDRIKPLMDWIDKIELWLEEVPPVD